MTLLDPEPPRGRRRDADGRARPALDLLIWDAPNIDMTLSTVIGARPTAASRPRFDAIAAWFVDGAGDPGAPDAPDVEACVFANIPPQPSARCSAGWRRCAASATPSSPGPSRSPTTTSTRRCSTTSRSAQHSHRLRRLVVFSGDGRNFAEPLEDLAARGTQVVVVAFSEVAGYAISSDLLEFIDIEDVPGAFAEPLDRVRLDALPPDGAWLRPTRSLRDFVSSLHRPPQRLTGIGASRCRNVRFGGVTSEDTGVTRQGSGVPGGLRYGRGPCR